MSVGCGDNFIYDNEFSDNTQHNILTYLGADKPIVAKSGRHQDNVFKENKFSGKGESVKLKETDGTQLLGNRFQKADKIR
ncbi:unnamed protein product, partial [Laminaria digitata]